MLHFCQRISNVVHVENGFYKRTKPSMIIMSPSIITMKKLLLSEGGGELKGKCWGRCSDFTGKNSAKKKSATEGWKF